MVCLGNICRSPLAEGILRRKVKERKLNWIIDSAGTSNYHIGEPPHELSQKVARLYGTDLEGQCCRQFVKEDMLNFDRIYVMDSSNYNDVKRISGSLWNPEKTDLILNEIYPGKNKAVPDPWYGTEKDYHDVYNLLDNACDRIIDKLAQQ